MTDLTPVATVRQLREDLQGLLADLLGTYRLPGGSTVPAIYVVGAQRVPRDWSVTGLEVTIQEVPEEETQPLAGTLLLTRIWPVRLINYDPTTTLALAQGRLTRAWPDSSPVYQPASDLTYEQLDLRIRDPILTNHIRGY